MAPRKVIIDTDPGVDDVLAILLALASPELEVVAITITFGNTHARSAYDNLLKIFAALSRELSQFPEASKRYPGLTGANGGKKPILALGADEPVDGEKSVAAYFHGQDGLSNISETHPQFTHKLEDAGTHQYLELSKKASSEVILDILREEEEGSVQIVALGPLSNLALALAADSKTFARVGEVVWMGGALEVPGNTSPTAEFNCFADPYAAQAILDAVEARLFPIVMLPLDITTIHTIPFDLLIHPSSSTPAPTPLQEFTSAMLVRVRGLMKSFGLPDAMEMHDPVAIWYAVENAARSELEGEGSGGWSTLRRVFKVERKGEYTRGMCVVDRRGTGEGSFLRTKGSISNGVATNGEASEGSESVTPGAPNVVVKTPGSDVLQSLLLSRVFGTKSS